MSQSTNRTCGPCNGHCRQGRDCPARAPHEGVLDYLAKVLAAWRRAHPAS